MKQPFATYFRVSSIYVLFLCIWFLPLYVQADCVVGTGGGTVNNAGFGNISNYWTATQFTPSCSGTISAGVFRSRTSVPNSDNFRIYLESNSGGLPSNTVLAQDLTNVATDSACNDVNFTFEAPVDVVAGTVYWFVAGIPGGNAVSAPASCRGTAGGTYTTNSTDTTWNGVTLTSFDMSFSMTVVEDVPEVPLGGATSTVEQVQQNLYNGMVLFFISFFGLVWVFRKKS